MADDLNALVATFMTNVRSDFDRRMTEFTEDVAKLTSETPAGLAGLSRQSEWDDLPDLEEIKAIEEYEDFQRRKGYASLSAKYRHLNGAETGKTTAKSIMFSTLLSAGRRSSSIRMARRSARRREISCRKAGKSRIGG